MKLNYIDFVKKLFIYTLIIVVIGTGISWMLPAGYITPTLPFLYVFFFSATMVVHYVLLQVSLKKASSFINYFMLLTFGKLIFFLSIVLAYGLLRREDAAPFTIAFFILYFFFTIFEVNQSLHITRSIHKQRKILEEKEANNS